MRYHILCIIIIMFCSNCNLNSQSNGYGQFKGELSNEAVKKIDEYSPFSFTEKIVSNYRHYSYYETFGNSGISIQFNLKKNNGEEIKKTFKNYRHLTNSIVTYQDSNYVYAYNNKSLNIKIPELSEEFGDLSPVKLNDSECVDIYLIEHGKLSNVYINQPNAIYNYSIGIYYFKKQSKLVYWFLIY